MDRAGDKRLDRDGEGRGQEGTKAGVEPDGDETDYHADPGPDNRERDGSAGALSFLTRVPVGRWVDLDAEDVARGAVAFPVVGAGIGAIVGLVAVGLDARLGALLAAALAVAVEALVTGAIHFDALADSADGLGASDRERALEIMREPTIGSFGVTALLLDVVAKTAAIAAIVAGPRALLAVATAFAVGRAAPLALGWVLPYARQEGGSGSVRGAAPRSRFRSCPRRSPSSRTWRPSRARA